MEPTNPFRCFDRRYAIEMLSTGALLIGLAWFGKRIPDGTALRITIGVAETALLGFMMTGMLVRIRKLDELGQRIHLIAIAVAFGLVGLLVAAIECLTRAGVPVPPLGLWLWVFMLLAWGIGALVIARRYQ